MWGGLFATFFGATIVGLNVGIGFLEAQKTNRVLFSFNDFFGGGLLMIGGVYYLVNGCIGRTPRIQIEQARAIQNLLTQTKLPNS